jgi:hypothetical protein
VLITLIRDFSSSVRCAVIASSFAIVFVRRFTLYEIFHLHKPKYYYYYYYYMVINCWAQHVSK